MTPLLSITFPQGFWISKNIGHPTSGSGGKKTVKRYLKSEHARRQTDRQTRPRTFRLIESIGPKGRCFENSLVEENILFPLFTYTNWFTFSKHRPFGPMLSISRFVRTYVCTSVCTSVCSLLRYRLTVFLPPLPEVGCPIFLEIQNPWGKVMERSGLIFKDFCLEVV